MTADHTKDIRVIDAFNSSHNSKTLSNQIQGSMAVSLVTTNGHYDLGLDIFIFMRKGLSAANNGVMPSPDHCDHLTMV